jgi:hypothetical protein
MEDTMNLRLLTLSPICLLAGLGATLLPTVDQDRGPVAGPARYEVSITNLTRGQVFSPPVIALHSAEQPPLWTLGSPASPELAMVAEDAINGPLVSALQGSPWVGAVGTATVMNGPIPPGQTASIVLEANPGRFDRISLAGMLVTTNDAFYGLNGEVLPRNGAAVFTAVAYDAGSEANTEQCAHIPGPPCGNAMVRVPNGAEGYVHVHSGIFGIADLVPSQHDWRNPVAKVEVRRVRD